MHEVCDELLALMREVLDSLFENLADAIHDRDIGQILLRLFSFLMYGILIVFIGLVILFVICRFWKVLILPTIILLAIYNYSTTQRSAGTARSSDEVEEELSRERAQESYEDVRQLMFSTIQDVSENTSLVCPRDEFEIETASSRHFYMQGVVPIYQFDNDLTAEIDSDEVRIIQQELQRHAAKQIKRYPVLISSSTKGYSPIEILDVKNLGQHVLIEVVLTTDDSIPIIDARRRARMEHQKRKERFDDPRYK
jgi:hypothetical protein